MEGEWTHIAATYSASNQRARVSVITLRIPPYVLSTLINAPKPEGNNNSLKSKEPYPQTRGLSNLEMKHVGKLVIIIT